MALVINTNLGSINGQKNLNNSTSALATSMQRLSSGARINGAKDDAAGLAIADRMTSQIRGMGVAVRNAQDGISLTQVVEGSLGSLSDTLQRMRDLAVQSSSNAAVSATDREKMQTEFKALNDELLRVIQNSEFNGKKVLNGDLASGLGIQVGANTDANSRVNIAVPNMATTLAPVMNSSLYPKNESVDATFFAATVSKASNTIVNDAQLKGATEAAKLANAAVRAATLAANSPTDLALAKAASDANKKAADAIATSSASIFKTTNDGVLATFDDATGIGTIGTAGTGGLLGSKLVSDAFSVSVTKAYNANFSVRGAVSKTDAAIQAGVTTDSAQANSLLTTATQLAAAANADIESAAKTVYESTMNSITGDTLDVPDSRVLGVSSTLNDAVAIAPKGSFKADRVAQKAMAALDIAKAVAGSSYVNNPTKTDAANESDKQSFIKNNSLVSQTSMVADAVSTDYALSAIDQIDKAIAAVDTERSNLGSMQNRFNTTISNLQNGIENQSAARSRISDADFAMETANLSRAQILQQAGTAMLAQANQSGQSVLTLLR